MTAARNGEFDRPMGLLAPDATVTADQAAALAGTPERIDGRRWVATFFNGSAHAVLAVCVDDGPRPRGSTRGQAKVVFEFTVIDGMVRGITFHAEPEVLAGVAPRPAWTSRLSRAARHTLRTPIVSQSTTESLHAPGGHRP